MNKNRMKAIHPGEILSDELEATGLSANALAHKLCVPANRISLILNGQRGITADTAMRLARFFSTSPEFWLNLQRDYDLKTAQLAVGRKIQREVKPLDDAA